MFGISYTNQYKQNKSQKMYLSNEAKIILNE